MKKRFLSANKVYFDPLLMDMRSGREWNKIDREGGEFWGGRDALVECTQQWDPMTNESYWAPDESTPEYQNWKEND